MEGRDKTLTHNGRRHLPLPTGPYAVGCTDIMTSYLKLGVFVRLFYPSNDVSVLDRYLQWPLWIPSKEYLNGYAHRMGVPAQFFRWVHKIICGDLYIPAILQGCLRPAENKYPVVVLSHGLSGWRNAYSSICLELASYGFVVAALEHRDSSASASFYKKQARMSVCGFNPGSSLSDLDDLLLSCTKKESSNTASLQEISEQDVDDVGPYCHAKEWILYEKPTEDNELDLRTRQLKIRTKECMEALDLLENLNKGRFIANVLESNFDTASFKNQLDLKKIFFLGHSFGGATGILTTALEDRFNAAIFLDPWLFPYSEDQTCFSMIGIPFMCLLVESFQSKKYLCLAKFLQDMHKDSQFLVLKYAQHRDLCDEPFCRRFSFASLSSKLGSRIGKFDALDLSTDLILQYFGDQLGVTFRNSSLKLEILKRKHLRTDEYITKLIS